MSDVTTRELTVADIPAIRDVINTRKVLMTKSAFDPTAYGNSLPQLFQMGFRYFGVFEDGVLDGFHQFAFPQDPISGLRCAIGDINVTRAVPNRAKNEYGFSVNNTALFNFITTTLEAEKIFCWWLVYPTAFDPPLLKNKEDIRSGGAYTREILTVIPAHGEYSGEYANFVRRWLVRGPFQEDINLIRLVKAGHENDGT